jgi:hypothetical protein
MKAYIVRSAFRPGHVFVLYEDREESEEYFPTILEASAFTNGESEIEIIDDIDQLVEENGKVKRIK